MSKASTRFIDRPARGLTKDSGIASSVRIRALVGSPTRHDSSARLAEVGSRTSAAVDSALAVGAPLEGVDAHRVALELVDLVVRGARLAFVAPAVEQHQEAVAGLRDLQEAARGDHDALLAVLHRAHEDVGDEVLAAGNLLDE